MNERWLLDSNRDAQTILYASDQDINVMCHSQHWIMDGTFKVSPNDFTQIYTIHAWGPFENEAIPVAHAIMRSKNVNSYVQIFTKLREKMVENHGGIGDIR